jgi:hypothetical protein
MKISKTPVHEEGQAIEDYIADLHDFCIEVHGAFKGQYIINKELLADYLVFLMEYSSEPQYAILRLKFNYDGNMIPVDSKLNSKEDVIAEILRQRDLLDTHIVKHNSLNNESQTVKALSEVYYVFSKMTVNEIVDKLVKDKVLAEYADTDNEKELLDAHQRRIYRYISKYPSFAQMESFAYSKQQFKRI